MKWGPKCLPPKLLSVIITGLKKGFATGYQGGGDFVRNYSNKMKPDEETKATEKARETVEKGWGAGPFRVPPFPNPKCPKQAIVTKSFTIPKHKWIKDGALRLIFHKQLQVRDEDLHQKVFFADGQFWVDFCASFGSLYGNDIYSAFGNAH